MIGTPYYPSPFIENKNCVSFGLTPNPCYDLKSPNQTNILNPFDYQHMAFPINQNAQSNYHQKTFNTSQPHSPNLQFANPIPPNLRYNNTNINLVN